jgi:hypothetical protein
VGQSQEKSLDAHEKDQDIPIVPQPDIVQIEKEETFTPIPQLVEETVQQTVQLVEETVQILTESLNSVSRAIRMEDSSTQVPSVQQMQPSDIKPLPKGMRWAIASPDVNLSGNWKILVDDHFKKDYDTYLTNLGQPSLVRTVATSIVEMTTEQVRQEDEGRVLHIEGKNLRGIWERTLVASGSDWDHDYKDEEHVKTSLVTADQEQVQAEAWWESEGSVHRSFLRGVKKYGGGDFESKRYLMDNGNILVCESIFHPRDEEKQRAEITWKFVRL